MNPEFSSEEGIQLRTQNLTPVSPKPLSVPKPSNIPLLDIQMDPAFDNAAAYESFSPSTQIQEQGAQTASADVHVAPPADVNMHSYASNGVLPEAKTSESGLATDNVMSLDPSDQAQFENEAASNSSLANQTTNEESATASNDAALAFLQSLSFPDPTATRSDGDSLAHYNQPSDNAVVDTEQHQPTDAPNDGTSMNQEGEGVNFDALLDNLNASAAVPEYHNAIADDNHGLGSNSIASPVSATSASNPSSLPFPPGPASLPPRPPPQQGGPDIRSYHPHEQSPASKFGSGHGNTSQGNAAIPLNVPSVGANGLPAPPAASFQPQITAMSSVEQYAPAQGEDPSMADDEGVPFSPELQKLYDAFLKDEANYVSLGQWDQFPSGSRLFIGNLPSEIVQKEDIFRVFHKHGKLAQISIKQAYGFVQYLDAESCNRALQFEQGVAIRGRKIHLEVSKPQRNKNQNNDNRRGNQQRRSRSPEYARGGAGSGNQNKNDRYRTNDNNRQNRGRDGYRPGRSPSPRRAYGRSPDRYNGGGRRRSRSRSPLGRGGRPRSPGIRGNLDDDCPLPMRNPKDIPDIQVICQEHPERSFIQYVQQAFEGRGLKCDVLLLAPRLSEAGVIRRQIIEGVHAVMKLDRSVQYSNKFPLSVFDRGTPNNVRFEEYQDLDLNICVELVVRAKQNAARVAIQQKPQQPYTTPSNFAYGLPVAPSAGSGAQPPPIPPPFFPGNLSGMPGGGRPPVPPMPGMPQLDTASLQRLLGQVSAQNPQSSTPQQPQYPQSQQMPFNPPQPQQTPALPPTADLARLLASANAATPQPQQHQHQHQGYPIPPPAPSATPSANANNTYQNLLSNPAIAALLAGGKGTQSSPQPGQQYGQRYGQQQHGQQQQQQHQHPGQGGAGGGGGQAQLDTQNILAQLARYGR